MTKSGNIEVKRILVVATRNPGKLREIKEIIGATGFEVVGLGELPDGPEVVEDGLTFLANAKKKARAISQWSGCPALADDSGLEVDALGGRPGVHSSIYAGIGATDEENIRKLLHELSGVPQGKRGARFRCVMVLACPDGREWVAEGTWEGVIALEPRGSGGFGYDPVFFLPDLGRTVAELTPEEKNSMSHRAQALRNLRNILYRAAETIYPRKRGRGNEGGVIH